METARVHARIDRLEETDESGRKERNGAEGTTAFRARFTSPRFRVPDIIEINRRPLRIARDGPSMGSQSRKSAVRHPA